MTIMHTPSGHHSVPTHTDLGGKYGSIVINVPFRWGTVTIRVAMPVMDRGRGRLYLFHSISSDPRNT